MKRLSWGHLQRCEGGFCALVFSRHLLCYFARVLERQTGGRLTLEAMVKRQELLVSQHTYVTQFRCERPYEYIIAFVVAGGEQGAKQA